MKSKLYERIKCFDGYNVSIQAGDGKYCQPRDDIGPYTEVELGYPSWSDPLLDPYAENPQKLTKTVYPYVPANVARDLIVKHGGATSGEAPAGVLILNANILHIEENKTNDER